MELIAKAGLKRRVYAWDERGEHGGLAPSARNYKIFIEWCFKSSRIGSAKNRAGPLDIVCDAEAWLGFFVSCQAIVKIAAYAEIERPAPLCNCVLDVEGKLLYIRMSMKGKRSAA
jgi:hypothetical protein